MSFKTTLYGKYFLLDRIAIGGMAEVFKAKTFGVRGFERLLVIKRILPHLSKDEEFVEMFIDEAKIAVELTHANICQVTDLGKIADNYFIAMEYIDGKDLRAILKRCHEAKNPISVALAVYVILEALKGLGYAHRKTDSNTGKPLNLIHRDISPQNIMVSYHGDVKIVDFGIAKTESKLGRTQAGVLKGKFGYMSPEQASGLALDARTDLFSTGIIFYEILTGRRLFLGESDFDTLEKIKECKFPPPSKYNPAIPPELEHVVLKALAKDREDRFSSAQEMNTALTKVFYSNFPDFSVEQLSDFLQELFAEDIDREQESLRRAIDALPVDEIAAATSAAEAANDRLIESSSGRSPSLRSAISGNVSPPLKNRLRSAWNELNSRVPSPWWLTWGKLLVPFVAGILLIFGVSEMISIFSAPPKKPVAKKPISKLISVQVVSRPEGAELFINEELKGVTPVTLPLLEGKRVAFRIEKEGYEPFLDEFVPHSEKTVFGPYTLTEAQPVLGALTIESSPSNASIFINGKDTEMKTPATVSDLPLGEAQTLKLVLKGYQTKEDRVTLKTRTDSKAYELEPHLVTLTLRIKPSNASVYLNGVSHGHGEIRNLKGNQTYTLEVKAPGYHSRKYDLFLENDREEIIELKKIKIAYGTVSLGARPWATVYINGRKAGETPLVDHQLRVGKYKIEFRHPDFKTVTKNIRIKKGTNAPIIIDFQ